MVAPIDDPRWRESLAPLPPGTSASAEPAAELRQAAAEALGLALADRLSAPLFRELLAGGELPGVWITGCGANRAPLIAKLEGALRVPVRTFSPWPLVRWGSPPADLDPFAHALELAFVGPQGARSGIELAAERQEALHRAPSRRLTAALAVLLALVLGALLIGHGVRRQRELALVDREIQNLKLRMTAVEAVNREVQERRARLEYLTSMMLGRGRQADILRELTGLLPDSVYLTELTYRNRTVEITGLAPSASQLLPVLEGSPLFVGVEFSAPIVAQGAGLERFRIRLRLENAGG
jgi:Tfp pilus assembly protein PilN